MILQHHNQDQNILEESDSNEGIYNLDSIYLLAYFDGDKTI